MLCLVVSVVSCGLVLGLGGLLVPVGSLGLLCITPLPSRVLFLYASRRGSDSSLPSLHLLKSHDIRNLSLSLISRSPPLRPAHFNQHIYRSTIHKTKSNKRVHDNKILQIPLFRFTPKQYIYDECFARHETSELIVVK